MAWDVRRRQALCFTTVGSSGATPNMGKLNVSWEVQNRRSSKRRICENMAGPIAHFEEYQLVWGRWRISETLLKVREGSGHTVVSRCGQKELHVLVRQGGLRNNKFYIVFISVPCNSPWYTNYKTNPNSAGYTSTAEYGHNLTPHTSMLPQNQSVT